jgi:hypothetical protein
MPDRHFNSDSASVAAMIAFVLGIIFVGFYFAAVLIPVDSATLSAHNYLTQSGLLPLSQDHQNSLALTQLAVNDSPLICLFLLIISLIIVALREKQGTV